MARTPLKGGPVASAQSVVPENPCQAIQRNLPSPALALLGLATLPIAALAARGAFLYEAGSPNSTFVPALAMNVAVTLLTPSLVAVGLFLAHR